MTSRALIRIVAIVFAGVFMFSCTPTEPTKPVKGLSLSDDSVTAAFDGASTTLTIVARVDWTLSVIADGDWITPNVTSGTANSTVKIEFALSPNTGETTRKGTVYITASGEAEPYTLTITQTARSTLTGVNAWIHETLNGWYYWHDAVITAKIPSNSLAYNEFLTRLVLNAYDAGAKDTSENPPTIDGSYNYDNVRFVRDQTHVYSYITRTSAVGTRAEDDMETIFGFDVAQYPKWVSGDFPNAIFDVMVTSVVPGSPAAEAGLKRGMSLTKYNGSNITGTLNNDSYIIGGTYIDFIYQLYYLEGGNSMTVTDYKGTEYDLTAAPADNTPVIFSDVVTSPGGKRVAYLVYNSFEQGPKSSERATWGEYDEELRTIFGGFKSYGAQEIVLDLRYNGGGAVLSSQLLSSLAGNVNTGQIFAKLKFHDEIADAPGWDAKWPNPEIWNFLNETNSMDKDKVYVLVTESSASSSELVINSLRGIGKTVILIGERTEGKNVGMTVMNTEEPIDGYDYEMSPITFKNLNAENFCNYAGGFEPTYQIDELYEFYSKGPDGVVYDFGNVNERLLKAALKHIDTGSVTPDPTTRSRTGIDRPVVKVLKDPRKKSGMLLYGFGKPGEEN